MKNFEIPELMLDKTEGESNKQYTTLELSR